MKNVRTLAVCLATTAMVAAMPASAATGVYDFTFTAVESSGTPTGDFSGRFTVTDDVITAITGSGALIGTIDTLFAPGSIAVDPRFAPNDNVFSATDPYLSFNGVTFGTTVFANINLFYNGDFYTAFSAVNNGSGGTLTVAAAAVPEPATWAMMLVGFGLIGAASRYRRRSTKVSYA